LIKPTMTLKGNNYSKLARVIALATAFTFSSTNLAFAAPPLVPSSVEALEHYSNARIDSSAIKVPAEIGKIQEAFQASSHRLQAKGKCLSPEACGLQPLVILIQDAHSIPEAQRNIQKLIQHFQNQYGIRVVGVEGAATKLDSQIFNSFPDKQLLAKTFDEYFERGELNGTAAAAVLSSNSSSGNAVIFHGVENWSLYEEGLAFYLEAVEKEPEILQGLQAAGHRLQEEKKKIYAKELLEVDKLFEAFKRNDADLVTILKKLKRIQIRGQVEKNQPQPVPLSIQMLLKEIEKDGKDQSTIEQEVQEIAEEIKKYLLQAPSHKPQAARTNSKSLSSSWSLQPAAWSVFNEKHQDFQTSRITPAAFALFLKELIESGRGSWGVGLEKTYTRLTTHDTRLKTCPINEKPQTPS